jgi:hypothetical protein
MTIKPEYQRYDVSTTRKGITIILDVKPGEDVYTAAKDAAHRWGAEVTAIVYLFTLRY